MRVALTGGGAFIGSHVLARMVGAGMDVTLVGPDAGPSRYAASLVATERVRFLRCEPLFSDADLLRSALGDIDAVVLLGHTMPRSADPERCLSEEIAQNLIPLVRLIGGLGGCRRFVFASSLEAHGDADAAPTTPFGIAKLAAERSLRALAGADATVTILRYASVFGPNESDRQLIPQLIRSGLSGRPLLYDGDGTEERDYVHVCDVAEATIAATLRGPGGAYDIGTGIGTSTVDLARLIADLVGAPGRPVARAADTGPHPARLVAATSAARDALGFTATRTLACGLKEEIGWIRSQLGSLPSAALAATA